MDDKTIAGSFSFYKMSEKKRRKKSLIFLIHLCLTQFIRAGAESRVLEQWMKWTRKVWSVRCGRADSHYYTIYRVDVDVSTLLNNLRRWFARNNDTQQNYYLNLKIKVMYVLSIVRVERKFQMGFELFTLPLGKDWVLDSGGNTILMSFHNRFLFVNSRCLYVWNWAKWAPFLFWYKEMLVRVREKEKDNVKSGGNVECTLHTAFGLPSIATVTN